MVSILGAVFRFIAANLTGLAVGYSVRDVAGAVTGADDGQSESKESWLTRFMRKTFGLPGWAAAIIPGIVLIYIAWNQGWISRKK